MPLRSGQLQLPESRVTAMMNRHDNYTEADQILDASSAAANWAAPAETLQEWNARYDATLNYALEDTNAKPSYPPLCLLCSTGLCLTHHVTTP